MNSQKVASKVKRLLVTGAACMGGACATVTQQHPPPPAACPAGADETHKAYGIDRRVGLAHLGRMSEVVETTVKEGDITAHVAINYGDIPKMTVLSGHLYMDKHFAYGRFTEARLPNGEKLPVCIETGGEGKTDGIPFLPGSRPGLPVVHVLVDIYAVQSFQ